jgi:hypothetical protein
VITKAIGFHDYRFFHCATHRLTIAAAYCVLLPPSAASIQKFAMSKGKKLPYTLQWNASDVCLVCTFPRFRMVDWENSDTRRCKFLEANESAATMFFFFFSLFPSSYCSVRFRVAYRDGYRLKYLAARILVQRKMRGISPGWNLSILSKITKLVLVIERNRT